MRLMRPASLGFNRKTQSPQLPGTSRDFLHCNKTHTYTNAFRIRTKLSKLSWQESFLPRCAHYEMFGLDQTAFYAGGSKHATPRCESPAPDPWLTTRKSYPPANVFLVHSSEAAKVCCGPGLEPDSHRVPFQPPGKKTGQEMQLLSDLVIQAENTYAHFLVLKSITQTFCSQTT